MLQENLILSQLIKNVYYREKVYPYLKSNFFEIEEYKKIFSSISSLLSEKVTILDRAVLLIKYPYVEIIDTIFEVEYSNENIDFLITETEKWAKRQALKGAILKSADIISTNSDGMEIEGLVREALSVSFDKDLGLDYINDLESRFERYQNIEKTYPSKFTMLDYYTNGGFQGKTLSVIVGQSNIGKTAYLCNIACNLISQGFNGIYLTLELSRDIIARRCDSISTNIPYFTLFQQKEKVENYFREYRGGNLFIKEYPPSKAKTINIRSYLKELEVHKNYKPEFIIVDYLNIMKPNHFVDNMYLSNTHIAMELRELALELDVPVITANQVTTGSYRNSNLELNDLRGGAGPSETADLVLALTQTEDQETENLISLKIIKNRLGRRSGKFETQIDVETMKVREIITSEDKLILEGNKSSFNVTEVNNTENNNDLDDLLKDCDKGFTEFS